MARNPSRGTLSPCRVRCSALTLCFRPLTTMTATELIVIESDDDDDDTKPASSNTGCDHISLTFYFKLTCRRRQGSMICEVCNVSLGGKSSKQVQSHCNQHCDTASDSCQICGLSLTARTAKEKQRRNDTHYPKQSVVCNVCNVSLDNDTLEGRQAHYDAHFSVKDESEIILCV